MPCNTPSVGGSNTTKFSKVWLVSFAIKDSTRVVLDPLEVAGNIERRAAPYCGSTQEG